jgi:hypothetical protein
MPIPALFFCVNATPQESAMQQMAETIFFMWISSGFRLQPYRQCANTSRGGSREYAADRDTAWLMRGSPRNRLTAASLPDWTTPFLSDVPIVVQHTRFDSRQSENAPSGAIAIASQRNK